MTSSHDCEADIVRHLVRLARKGAYALAASPDAADGYQVLSPRNAFAGPIATLSAAAADAAMGHGWLAPGPGGATLQLTRAGHRAVRRHLSTAPRSTHATAPDAQAHAAPGTPRKPATVQIAPRGVEGPLAWLRRHKDRKGCPLITEPQFEAGQRFAADFARAHLQARVTASWSATAPCTRAQGPGGSRDISDAAIGARDRHHRAVKAVGPEIGRLLVDVCCHDLGLEAAERARGWPARSGKVVLDMGLTALARHYGMLPADPSSEGPTPRPAMRRWGEPGYKSTLDAWI